MKKGKKRIKKKTSHGLTRNLTEGRIDGRTGLSICHGISRINTEGHGRTRKEEYKEEQDKHLPRMEEQAWNSAFAKLTIAQGHPSASSGGRAFYGQ